MSKAIAKETSRSRRKRRRTVVAPYEVGYGRPPPQHQFKPKQSGNIKGRPKKLKPGCRGIDYFLDEVVEVHSEGRKVRYTKRELAYMHLANSGAKGDPKSIKILLEYERRKAGGETGADPALFDPKLTEAILREHEEDVRRRAQLGSRKASMS